MSKHIYDNRVDEILDNLKERILNDKFEDHIESYVYYGGDIGRQCEVYTEWIDDLKNEDIDSVVTKQQFSNMEYRL